MKFLADENFNNDIVRGVWRRIPEAQIVRVQDTPIASAADQEALRYAAEEGFIVLTHAVNTLRGISYERLGNGLPVPGVFLIVEQSAVAPITDSLECDQLMEKRIRSDAICRDGILAVRRVGRDESRPYIPPSVNLFSIS